MSDFTKEELECLHNAIAVRFRDIPMSETNAIRRSELVGKIQSLLDNYCEHESSTMSTCELERKFKVYREQILPEYENDPDKVPPHLEPDFNEGWK